MLESRAKRSALGAAPDITVIDVSLNFLRPKTLLNCWKNHTSKQRNGRCAIFASHFAKKPVSIRTNEM